MKKHILKSIFTLCLGVFALTSCTKDDDYEIPPFIQPFYIVNFENQSAATGTGYAAALIEGGINVNISNTDPEAWGVRSFNNNKFMQFSSFYSEPGAKDDVWFILPEVTVETNQTMSLNFDVAQRYPEGKFPLNTYYSTDFDGKVENIQSATWVILPYTPPTVNDEFIKITDLSYLNESNEAQKIYFAFNYKGAKTEGPTTTVQVDNIKLIIN